MAKKTYQEIMRQKHFYRNAYRKCLSALVVSCLLMAGLSFGLYYLTISEPVPNFYASQSAGLLTQIQGLDEANPASTALLAPDPVEEMKESRELNVT